MLPIVLIHGYASEGDDTPAAEIYGTLPDDLRAVYGQDAVLEIDLARWISLNDGICLDDIAFAMDRALKARHRQLSNGFHLVIHSTGALVARNWIRRFSPRPSPIRNLVHLAGANFGSGLAHIGRGQLARWGRFFMGTGRGLRILHELEFGSWKTLDLHRHFLQPDHDMRANYRVQEFCLAGSQTLPVLRPIPIRYLKEDSADNTVRTSSCNLNLNYLAVAPTPAAAELSVKALRSLVEQRRRNELLDTSDLYQFDTSGLASQRPAIPFCVLFETAHFGDEYGIVSGSGNREQILPLLRRALDTPHDDDAYAATADAFHQAHQETFRKAAKLKAGLFDWDKQSQYEGHAQLVFRLKDQFGAQIKDFDITIKSTPPGTRKNKLEAMIEDKHLNKRDFGTIAFYLRTQRFDRDSNEWVELLDDAPTVHLEITAHEAESDDIEFVPLSLKLTPTRLRSLVQTFRSTVIDVTLLRLPSAKVFALSPATL